MDKAQLLLIIASEIFARLWRTCGIGTLPPPKKNIQNQISCGNVLGVQPSPVKNPKSLARLQIFCGIVIFRGRKPIQNLLHDCRDPLPGKTCKFSCTIARILRGVVALPGKNLHDCRDPTELQSSPLSIVQKLIFCTISEILRHCSPLRQNSTYKIRDFHRLNVYFSG